MPTAAAAPPAHHRLHSTTDPFSDPIAAAPRLSYDSPAASPVRKERRFYTGDTNPAPLVDARSDSPRAKMSRSQTQAANSIKVVPASRRTHSQDSVPQPATDNSKSKKKDGKSAHADAIDLLDYSGVGPALFHHDGPFDACAPSRNKHRTKAPMLAWGMETGTRDDPMAAAARVAGREKKPPVNAPSAYAYDNTAYTKPDKKKKDVDAIAEAWGIHEPEPYEEFFSGGYASNAQTTSADYFAENKSRETRRTKDHDAPPRSSGAGRRPTRTTVPPPQPVLVDVDAVVPVSPGGSGPKRNTSIMGRFRKMRDSPNVPMNDNYGQDDVASYDQDGYSSGYRSRGERTLEGRFKDLSTSPTSPDSVDGFVNVQDPKYTKDLPVTPGGDAVTPSRSDGGDYFEGSTSPGGIGRKGSLLRKMKGAVRGGR